MQNMPRWRAALVFAVVTTVAPCQAITIIEPFVGEYSEGFESFPPGEISGSAENNAGPAAILNGHATLSGINPTYALRPFYVWSDGFSIDDLTQVEGNVSAIPFDGTKGLSLQSVLAVDPVARIDFTEPVRDFGGYWVHAVTRERAGPIMVTLLGATGETLDVMEIEYDYAGLKGVHQWFGWSSQVPIHAVTYTGFFAGVDGIQINVVPEPTSTASIVIAGIAFLRCVVRRPFEQPRATPLGT